MLIWKMMKRNGAKSTRQTSPERHQLCDLPEKILRNKVIYGSS